MTRGVLFNFSLWLTVVSTYISSRRTFPCYTVLHASDLILLILHVGVRGRSSPEGPFFYTLNSYVIRGVGSRFCKLVCLIPLALICCLD